MVGSPPLTGQSWDYAPAPESRDIATIAADYGLLSDGEFTRAADGKQFTTVNPATEEALAKVAEAGSQDVGRAVSAARGAFEQTWGPMPGRDRAKYLYRIARAIQERAREFAVLESLDRSEERRVGKEGRIRW